MRTNVIWLILACTTARPTAELGEGEAEAEAEAEAESESEGESAGAGWVLDGFGPREGEGEGEGESEAESEAESESESESEAEAEAEAESEGESEAESEGEPSQDAGVPDAPAPDQAPPPDCSSPLVELASGVCFGARPEEPAPAVSWPEADAACRDRGLRLCSRQERRDACAELGADVVCGGLDGPSTGSWEWAADACEGTAGPPPHRRRSPCCNDAPGFEACDSATANARGGFHCCRD